MSDPLSIVKRAALGREANNHSAAQLVTLGEQKSKPILDFFGIGIGPFNLGLACLTESIANLNGIFVDARAQFIWHPGMLIGNTRLQTPYTADLVTMADPTSKFSFLNYAKLQGRLYSFCIRENLFLLRKEYNHYCQWAASELTNLHFNIKVVQIRYIDAEQYYLIKAECTKTHEPRYYRARKIILGTGTSPAWPANTEKVTTRAIHSSNYLQEKPVLLAKRKIIIVGGGQSAAEIFFDLLQESHRHSYHLHWLTRSAQFSPLDYNKLSLELSSPDYLVYFSSLSPQMRRQLISEQQHLYKGINRDLLDAIFDCLYQHRLEGRLRAQLNANSELLHAEYQASAQKFKLSFHQCQQQQDFQLESDGLIVASGYRYQVPEFLDSVRDRICWDDHGVPKPNMNYAVDITGKDIFVQNLGLDVHGFVTPDLSMAAYRNSIIANHLAGRNIYTVEQRIAFQDFFAPGEKHSVTPLEMQAS